VLAAISVLIELANFAAVTASSAICAVLTASSASLAPVTASSANLAVVISPVPTVAPASKLVAVTFLEVPESLINSSSLPAYEVFAANADILVVAIFTP